MQCRQRVQKLSKLIGDYRSVTIFNKDISVSMYPLINLKSIPLYNNTIKDSNSNNILYNGYWNNLGIK